MKLNAKKNRRNPPSASTPSTPPRPTRGGPRPRSSAGPRCKVCRDPNLPAITRDLAAGMSYNATARKFGFTTPVVWKHAREHMGAALLEHNLSAPVLESIRNLNLRSLRILAEAESGKWKNPETALKAIRECRNNLELIAKLTGELKQPAANEPTRVEIVYVDKQLVVTANEPPPAIDASAEGV